MLSAEEPDRAPEIKLGPAANAMERREMREAEAEAREYQPVTERGRAVHAARQARAMIREVRERMDLARDTYGIARGEGQGRVSAGLAALRARERLEKIVARGKGEQKVLSRQRDRELDDDYGL